MENKAILWIGSFGEETLTPEHHVTITLPEACQRLEFGQQMGLALDALHQAEEGLGANLVFCRFLLSDAANQEQSLRTRLGQRHDFAASIIQQPPLNGTKIAIWAYLIGGVQPKLGSDGLTRVKHGSYEHFWTASCHDDGNGAKAQTANILNRWGNRLKANRCTLKDNCVRTWFFVNDIDNQYKGVVDGRNEVFDKEGLTTDSHFISSTGIAGRQSAPNAWVQMDAYAVKGLAKAQMGFLHATGHLNRTSEYGVRFERGTYVDYGDRREVYISGTASIDNRGNVLYAGDIRKQCLRMWANVEALLKEAECGLEDTKIILCYLRDTADCCVVKEMFEQKFGGQSPSKPQVPYLLVSAGVCRPSWLIEMECIATKAIHTGYPNF